MQGVSTVEFRSDIVQSTCASVPIGPAVTFIALQCRPRGRPRTIRLECFLVSTVYRCRWKQIKSLGSVERCRTAASSTCSIRECAYPYCEMPLLRTFADRLNRLRVSRSTLH